MAGSISWREYTSDHGSKYSIQLDKSSADIYSAITNQRLANARAANWKLPPKSLIFRKIHCVLQFNLSVRRSFICGNPLLIGIGILEDGSDYLQQQADPALGTPIRNWLITGYTGEKFTPPLYYNQLDSGLNDGTPVDN